MHCYWFDTDHIAPNQAKITPDQQDSLQWHHNENNDVPNHRRLDCLLNRLFRRTPKKSNLRVAGLCEGNPPVTGVFPSQNASKTEIFPFDDVIMGSVTMEQPSWMRACITWTLNVTANEKLPTTKTTIENKKTLTTHLGQVLRVIACYPSGYLIKIPTTSWFFKVTTLVWYG